MLILDEEICVDDQMEQTLVNINQLRSYEITAQDNLFANSQIFISSENHNFSLPLVSKVTVLRVAYRTPMY